jgi:hypothetical protein
MKLNDIFDRIAIINLPERSDRRAQIAAELAHCGLSLEAPGVSLFRAIRPESAGDFPGLGARGAYLSHLAVLRAARADGIRRLLVLEDDLVIERSLDAALPRLAPVLAGDAWDIAYLGHLDPREGALPAFVTTDAPQQCLHFVAIHARCFDALIAYLEACLLRPAGHPDGGAMHVDGAISMFRARHPACRTLLALPSLGHQRPSRSDITDNRWYDRSRLLRSFVAVARTLKHRLRGAALA